MNTYEKLVGAIEILESLAMAFCEEDEPETTDVTDECEAVIGYDTDGAMRLYLTHNGNIIFRAGCDKVPSLTSFAEANGYSLVTGSEGLRGSYFKVFKG